MLASRETIDRLAPTVTAFARRPTEAEIMANDWSYTPGTRDPAGTCRTCDARSCEEHHDWCGTARPAPVASVESTPPALDPEPEDEPDIPVDLVWAKRYGDEINRLVGEGKLTLRLEDGMVRLFARIERRYIEEVAL